MAVRMLIPLLLLPATLLADDWVSNSDGSFVFEAYFDGDPLPGQFPEFTVSFSEESLVVTVPLASSDMGDEEMNAILHDPVWLAVDDFAQARYASTDVRCSAAGECVSTGELSLKGVTRPLEIPFSWTSNGDESTLRGELELDRTNFNVGSGQWSTGESINLAVTLRFDVRLTRVR